MYLRFAELGLEKERILYTRVGIPMYDLNLLIHNPSEYTSNANLMRNPETIAKLVHDQVMEQHSCFSIPTHLADAHMKGDIYIKDREYFSTRDYCAISELILPGTFPHYKGKPVSASDAFRKIARNPK
jgi:anaerobic ribonucleoside-triphosphate reductase